MRARLAWATGVAVLAALLLPACGIDIGDRSAATAPQTTPAPPPAAPVEPAPAPAAPTGPTAVVPPPSGPTGQTAPAPPTDPGAAAESARQACIDQADQIPEAEARQRMLDACEQLTP